jgi:NTE family protein
MPASTSGPLRAFVAFAGGGAKGLIHVGALRALEKRPVKLCGLAGTSAGAIVAALAAAGFSSDDLIGGRSGTTLVQRLEAIDPKIRRATDFFGPLGWFRVWLFRLAIDHRPGIALAAISAVALCAPVFAGWLLALNIWAGLTACAFEAWVLLSLIGGLAV